MLTIKKRFPSQKLYLYGGTAFILGFAAIMTLLVQTNTHIHDFMSVSPITFSSSTPTNESATQTDTPIVSQEQVFTTPTTTQSSQTQTQGSSNTEQPSTSEPIPTEPTPAEPTPAEPAPTDPDPAPTDPTPQDPSNPIGDILDGIIP